MKSLSQLNHAVRSFNIFYGLDSLKKMINTFKPDLILTMVGFKMPTSMLDWIKKQKIPTAIWMTEDPYFTDKTLNLIHHFDYVFTIESSCVDFYNAAGHKNVHHLPLGTNQNIFLPQSKNKNGYYDHDICFVGYAYPERIKFTKFLLDHSSHSILTIGGNWQLDFAKYQHNRRIRIINHWVEPQRVASIYNRTKIILNSHRPYQFKYNRNGKGVINQSINNRTFDIASCAAFQLIDHKPDLINHFSEGKEIISFTSTEDLLKKVNYYLEHEKERKEIAKNARQRVLYNDTFTHRLNRMMNIIKN